MLRSRGDVAQRCIVGGPRQQARCRQQHPARVVGDLERCGRRDRLAGGLQQDRSPRRPESLRDVGQLIGDDRAQHSVVAEDRVELKLKATGKTLTYLFFPGKERIAPRRLIGEHRLPTWPAEWVES